MKAKTRNGVPFKAFLAEELEDQEVRSHYEKAKASHALAAEAVIKARRRAGLTQTQLARRIGSDQKGIWRLETGRQNTTVETLAKVAEATGSYFHISMTPKARAK